MNNTTRPKLGRVVCFAWFPDHNNPNRPGQKYRPVLISDFDLQTRMFTVIFGTSQRIDHCGPGEFVVVMDGLSKPTKFCLGYQRTIPASEVYFVGKDGKKNVLGELPMAYNLAFERALKEI